MNSKNPILRISIFNSIAKMCTASLYFFLGVHFNNIGLSGAEIGIIFAAGILTSIITILPSGFSNDRFKSKHLIAIALTLLGTMYLGLSFTHEFIPIVMLSLLGGLGTTLYTASSDSLFYKSTNKEQVPKKIGIFQGLNYLMIGLGLIAAGYILENNLSFEKLFIIFAGIFYLLVIISQFILPKTLTSNFELLNYKKDIFKPKVLAFLGILFLVAIHFGAENTTYGLFLSRTLNLSRSQMGLYMGTAILTMAFTVVFIGKKLSKWKIERVLIFGLFASGLGHILMTINNPKISIIFRIFHEMGDAAIFFFIYYGITKLFDLSRIGGNAGIFALTSTIGAALGAIIFGPLGASWGYQYPLIISGGTTLIAFILTLQYLHHFAHNHEE
jgi:MFS family permease